MARTKQDCARELLGLLVAAEFQYEAVARTLEQAILRTPTSLTREQLTEVNIRLMDNKQQLHLLVNELTRASDGL